MRTRPRAAWLRHGIVAGIAAAGVGLSGAALAQDITVTSFGGIWEKAITECYAKEFEKRTGHKANVLIGSPAQWMSQIEANPEKPPISVLVSTESTTLAAGQKGKRYALPNSKIMIHQPSGGFQGQATDIQIHAREIIKTRARLNEIYARHTGTELNEIEEAMERDKFMDPDEALTFGLIDEVVEKRPVPADGDGGDEGKSGPENGG